MLEKARILGGWIAGGIHGDVTRLHGAQVAEKTNLARIITKAKATELETLLAKRKTFKWNFWWRSKCG